MPEENAPTPEPTPPAPPEQPTLLGGVAPDEMFARGMQTAKMTSGAGGTWQPPGLEEAAQLFPGYAVVKLLGRGGMGAVYQARELELDRLVAIKLLPLEVSVDKEFADRFRREARAMAKLHHPNIITVFAFGTTREGHLYFVMEYVEGANLADIIHGGATVAGVSDPGYSSRLTPEQALAIVEQICTALAYAHHKGIVHRDIKPANVMIDTESQVKVADFGLARLTDPSAEQMGHTMTGTVMGTPDYMAPEQMEGMNVDHRADIYSLGVMLYEMLCRQVPKGVFQAPSYRTGCDTRIDAIVIKAMQQAPDHRYQSTQEMKTDVISARTPLTMAVTGPTQVVHPRSVAGGEVGTPRRGVHEGETELVDGGQRGAPSLPAPEGALMKASASSAPKKSKLPLFGGIVAIVALIAAIIVWAKQSNPSGGPRSGASQTSRVVGEKDQGRTGARPSEALEPGAIKLWDSPEKIPDKPGVSWKDDALFVDSGGGLTYNQTTSRDSAIRALMRLNSDSSGVHLSARWKTAGGKASYYRLSLSPGGKRAELDSVIAGTSERLGSWPLPAKSAAAQWAQVELRAVGDQLTVLVDGVGLGSVRNSSISEPGGVGLYATANGYFRDIVYVPLDKPGAVAGVTDPGPASPPTTAPAGASAVQTFAGHRYQFVPGAVTWDEAKAKAEGMGGHLATITSTEEQAFIVRTFGKLGDGGHRWLGGFQENVNGPWKWVTDEAFTFTHWSPGEPNHSGTRLMATSAATLVWHDVGTNDAENAGFLVEWDDAGNASATTPGPQPASTAEAWVRKLDRPEDHSPNGPTTLQDGWVLKRSGAVTSTRILEHWNDAAIRAEFRWVAGGKTGVIALRENAKQRYSLERTNTAVRLIYFSGTAKGDVLKQYDIAEPQDGEIFTMELRAVGRALTVKLDGREVFHIDDDRLPVGSPAIYVVETGGIRNIEVLNLDKPATAVSP